LEKHDFEIIAFKVLRLDDGVVIACRALLDAVRSRDEPRLKTLFSYRTIIRISTKIWEMFSRGYTLGFSKKKTFRFFEKKGI